MKEPLTSPNYKSKFETKGVAEKMFLRTKLTTAGLMLGLLTAVGALAQAQQPSTQNPGPGTQAPGRMGRGEGRGPRRGPGPGGAFGPGVLRELNLSDDQKQQVRSIIQQSFTSNKAVREELQQLGEKRRQGTLTPEERARAKTLHEEMLASMKDTETKIAAVLTPEQKAKAEELMKERRANQGRFAGPRREFPGQPGQGNPPPQKPSNP
jgi:Spy/CpxP family protein refolding chaperone